MPKKTIEPKVPKTTSIEPEEYDLLILGSGAAGKLTAWTLAAKGMKTAVVERKYVGGACPNIACLPSKNIIHSAKVVSYFRRSKEFGIHHEGVTIDMSGVRDRKRKMVAGLNEMYMENYGGVGRKHRRFTPDPARGLFQADGAEQGTTTCNSCLF